MNQARKLRTAGSLAFEALEDRRLLAAASFGEQSQLIGLSGLLGGSGEFHAGGLVFTDLNTDGFADLYLIGPSSRGNRLFINVDDGTGDRAFVRAVADGGAGYGDGNSTGAVAADYDNDGDLDVYVTNFQADNILFKNMWMEDHPTGVGDPTALRFVDVTASTDPTPANPANDIQHGLAHATFQNPNPTFGNDVLDNSLAAAWADVNRDGWVDLYVGSWDGTNGDPATSEDGQLGERDTLYLNNGDGTFTDITMANSSAPQEVLIDDGSFERATPQSTTTNSNWTTNIEGESAQFQAAPWAASDKSIGVWFQGFRGSATDPVDAQVTQVVTAPVSGDYSLRFDARFEANFASAVGGFQVSISSDGTGGSNTIDILSAAPDFNFNTYTLELPSVNAGDNLTIVAEMIDATGGVGPALSGMVDAFALTTPEVATPDQVGGWQYFDGSFNDPELPAEFSGQNALQFADFNNDGWQDLIVATMGGGGVGPNRDMLYMNLGLDANGDWLGYSMVSYEIGFGGTESSDMGVAVADLDNDGDLDYFSTLLPDAHPLWINNLTDTGDLGFSRTTISNTFSWGANFHDFDNNGRVDLLVGTDIDRRSYLHLQGWDGTFNEQAVDAGLTSEYSTRGVAVADYNRDGWSEAALWARNGNSPGIQFYENTSEDQNANFHFLTLELEGDPTLPGQFRSTRDAIGARAYVTADFNGDGAIGLDETRMEEVLSGHSNASTTSSLALEFGLGAATSADVRIAWSSGRETMLHGVAADQFLEVKEQVLSGDFDFDNDLDIDDIDLLIANIAVGPNDPLSFDLTGDGLVDLADRDEWLALAGATNLPSGNPFIVGDANLDGTVDGQDFIAWNTHKFTNMPAWSAGDFNADGAVDGQDFIIWNTHKFTSANSAFPAGRHGVIQRANSFQLSNRDDASTHRIHHESWRAIDNVFGALSSHREIF